LEKKLGFFSYGVTKNNVAVQKIIFFLENRKPDFYTSRKLTTIPTSKPTRKKGGGKGENGGKRGKKGGGKVRKGRKIGEKGGKGRKRGERLRKRGKKGKRGKRGRVLLV
jgi:hypothetical protein